MYKGDLISVFETYLVCKGLYGGFWCLYNYLDLSSIKLYLVFTDRSL